MLSCVQCNMYYCSLSGSVIMLLKIFIFYKVIFYNHNTDKCFGHIGPHQCDVVMWNIISFFCVCVNILVFGVTTVNSCVIIYTNKKKIIILCFIEPIVEVPNNIKDKMLKMTQFFPLFP